MEPQGLTPNGTGAAPLVGWSPLSPSLASTPYKMNNNNISEGNMNDRNLNERNMNDRNLNERNMNERNMNESNMNKDYVNEVNLNGGSVNRDNLNESNVKEGNNNERNMNENKVNDLNENKINDEKRNEKTPLEPSEVTVIDVQEVKFAGISEHEVKFLDNNSSLYSSTSSLEEDPSKPKMPDGGWGWVVVFSSLILSMVADGISFSFGLLYIEFLTEFGASKSATAWIGSLFMAVPLLTGPIMSALVDRYGCRKMTMLGGLISAVGFVASAYAKNITTMYFTFGVVAGLGLGLCYVTAVVSIAFWFDKKRNLAVGLGACGTGIGTFVYAPMTQYFIEEFGWRGTTLLLAGTFLNMCVCGALMRDPDWVKKQNRLGGRSSKKTSSTYSVSGKSFVDDFPDMEEVRKLLKNEQTNEYQLLSLITSMQSPDLETRGKELHRSDLALPTFVKQNEHVPLEVLEQLSSNTRLYNLILENYPSLLSCRSASDKGLNTIAEDLPNNATRVPVTISVKLKEKKPKKGIIHQHSLPEKAVQEPLIAKRKTSLDTLGNPLIKYDSLPWLKKHFYNPNHHHLKNIKLHRNSVMYRGAMLNIRKYRLRASSCPDIYRNSMTTLAKENQDKWYTEWLDLLQGMVDFSLFLDMHFLFMSLSTILLFIWFIIPYFYLAEHLLRFNYTESEASFIISLIGITNTIGMIFLGWAGDQPWMNVLKTYSACLVLCGFSCIAMLVFTENYVMLAVSAGLFGLFFASSFVFTPVILVELVPLEQFTTAYGLILLCQGIGNLIGPPLAGLLFDLTQSWGQSFIQAGIWIIVSGVLISLIPFTENRRFFGSRASIKGSVYSEKDSFA